MKIRYAISLWNFFHYAKVASLEEELANIRTMGYGVELWGRWHDRPNLYVEEHRGDLKRALDGMPVSLHTALVAGFAEHQAQVDAARALGARILVVHSDEFYVAGRRKLDVALCRDVVNYAAEQGVLIALENGQLSFLEAAVAAVDGLRICLDVGHVYLTDDPMGAFLTGLKPFLVHLHLQDIPRPAEANLPRVAQDHFTPGTGNIPDEDWELLFATLQEIDFDGTAVFEIRPRNPYQNAQVAERFLSNWYRL